MYFFVEYIEKLKIRIKKMHLDAINSEKMLLKTQQIIDSFHASIFVFFKDFLSWEFSFV